MRQNKRKKKPELLDPEEFDEQMRQHLYQLAIREMEQDSKMRSQALRLSQKRKKQVDSWVI